MRFVLTIQKLAALCFALVLLLSVSAADKKKGDMTR